MVNGNRIRALRYAREVVSDLRWRGMTVPALYTSMAEEFHALVRSGAYTAWVASAEKARASGLRPPQARQGRGRSYAEYCGVLDILKICTGARQHEW
jgi:hypothetical protein